VNYPDFPPDIILPWRAVCFTLAGQSMKRQQPKPSKQHPDILD